MRWILKVCYNILETLYYFGQPFDVYNLESIESRNKRWEKERAELRNPEKRPKLKPRSLLNTLIIDPIRNTYNDRMSKTIIIPFKPKNN